MHFFSESLLCTKISNGGSSMQREELRKMGLTDEQVNNVMGMHSAEVNDLHSKVNTITGERDQYKNELDSNSSKLKDLQKSAKDNEALQGQLNDLQQQFKQSQDESAKKIASLKLNSAVDVAIAGSNARNGKAVRALLDMGKIQMGEDGKLTGLDDQLTSLQESDSYLFEDKSQNTSNSTISGNPSGGNGGGDDNRDAFRAALGLKDK